MKYPILQSLFKIKYVFLYLLAFSLTETYAQCPSVVNFVPNTTSLPNGTIGASYTQPISQTGLTGSINWSISPNLPSGLFLDMSTGQILGTCTSASNSATYIVTADNGICSATKSYNFAVVCGTINVFPATLPNGAVGSAYNQTLSVSNLVFPVYSVLPAFPAGISLASNGQITGTPTTVTPAANYVVTISQGICTTTKTYNFAISGACPTSATILPAPSTNGFPTIIPPANVGTFYSTTFTATSVPMGATFTYVTLLPTTSGLTLNPTTGVLSGIPTTQTSYIFSFAAQVAGCGNVVGTNYQIFVNAPLPCPAISIFPANSVLPTGAIGSVYPSTTISQTGLTSGTITFSIAPALPTGLSLNASTGVISGTPSVAIANGSYTVTASNVTCFDTKSYTLTVTAVPCPTITLFPTNTALLNGTVGVAYPSTTISQTGLTGTVTFSVSPALVLGLSLNANTGVISGTPTATVSAGLYTITASNGTCSNTKNYTLTIVAGAVCPTINISSSGLGYSILNTPYSQTFTQTGLAGTPIWSVIGALPVGLTLASNTGIVSGTPTTITSTGFVLQVTDGVCTQILSYVIFVSCPTIAFTNTTVSITATVGVPYTLNAGATGNTAMLTYSVFPALPAGLSLNTVTGVISGTPTTASGATSQTVLASQSGSFCSRSQTYSLTIAPNLTTAVDNSLSNQIKISPNPSKDVFNIDFGGLNVDKSVVRVYDAQGKMVFITENTNDLISISLDKFANGLYFLEIETSKGRVSKRLAKQ